MHVRVANIVNNIPHEGGFSGLDHMLKKYFMPPEVHVGSSCSFFPDGVTDGEAMDALP